MKYIVKRGDSLIKIATNVLKNRDLWRELALMNHIKPPYKIYIGQKLRIPIGKRIPSTVNQHLAFSHPLLGGNSEANLVDSRAFFFILADEVLPSGKVVRKVLQYPNNMNEIISANPEKFGMRPPNPKASISIGEHALGLNKSPYLSASTLPKGAPNIQGRPVYIDISKAKNSGVIIHSTNDIIADLNRLKVSRPTLSHRIDRLKEILVKVEKEVLLEGDVPKKAIKSSTAMNTTRSLRVVQFVGFAITAYDLGVAGQKSVRTDSPKPIVAESIRQIGGWGSAIAGAKIGGVTGAALGIETGPGAILTGAVGAIIFGAAGYYGADWVADFIDEN